MLLELNSTLNVGFTFLCFTFAILANTKIFELLVIVYKQNIFELLIVELVIQSIAGILAYHTTTFSTRFVMFGLLNGSFGCILPVLSTLKSKYLPEDFRTLFMGMYKFPTYLTSIAVLMLTFAISLTKVLIIISIFSTTSIVLTLYFVYPGAPAEVNYPEQLSRI